VSIELMSDCGNKCPVISNGMLMGKKESDSRQERELKANH
jgi:hypothetical protein